MAETGFATFSTTVDKTNHLLRELEDSFGWSKQQRNLSYGALRAVLHAVRDRLTVDEAAHLSAQLTTLVRGVYFEDWDPSRVPVKMHREQFLERVQREFPYQVDVDIETFVHRVMQALRSHVSEGEWEDIRSNFPKDLSPLLA
jgi:uncharacterized protein (DUF2267 family)